MGEYPSEKDPPESEVVGADSAPAAEDVTLSLKILPLTYALHQKHGLRHNDYQRYRGYCARRIARVRQAVKLVQGEKRKYTRKPVTLATVQAHALTGGPKSAQSPLEIPLMTTERAWAYAMQLKFEMNSEPRKKYHMISRLRKAAQEAAALESLIMSAPGSDARTKLEAQAYHAWIRGTHLFERQDWPAAMEALTLARTIYEELSLALNEEEAGLYQQRMADIVPSLRFCAYNSGDQIAKRDLLQMRGGPGGLGTHVEELINQTREEQAATLQSVTWRQRQMPVKHEKVRLFLLREQEFSQELEKNADSVEGQVEAYESLLMDCRDAIRVLRDELLEDPNFRQRQQTHEGPVSASHFLYTYLLFMKSTQTIKRNLVMLTQMREALDGRQPQTQKPVKPQDLIRLYETIIQHLTDMPLLAGLEEDLAFKHEIEAKVVFYQAWRCYFIALSFLSAQKWPEAMALFQRATHHAQKATANQNLDSSLRSEVDQLVAAIESRQFMAHANSILDSEEVAKDASQMDPENLSALVDRLDTYCEDPQLLKGKPNLVDFPPSFAPIPCKPLFFDLARERLEFPNLNDRLATPSGGQPSGGASGGWLGGWLGWGGKK